MGNSRHIEEQEALETVIAFDESGGFKDFEQGFGVLMNDLHDAVGALHHVLRNTDKDDDSGSFDLIEPARKLLRIRNAINEAIARGREIDTD